MEALEEDQPTKSGDPSAIGGHSRERTSPLTLG